MYKRICNCAILLIAMALGVNAGHSGTELILVDVPGSQIAGLRALNNRGEGVGTSYSTGRQFQVFYWSQSSGAKILGTHSNRSATFNTQPDINDSGMVSLSAGVSGWEHAFRWSAKAGFLDLGSLGGDAWTSAINNHGEVVGYSANPQGFNHAFIWQGDSGMKDLGTLGGWQSWALDLNDRAEVVGVSMLSNGLSHAFIWSERSGMRGLGVPAGYDYSQGLKINNQGEVLGTLTDRAGTSFAFYFSDPDGMIVLNPAGSTWTYPEALNDRGEVILNCQIGTTTRAFLWSKKSGYIDLGTLGGSFAFGTSLNHRGDVVGASSSVSETTAFVWSQKDGMRSLKVDGRAEVINDHGDVAGHANIATGQKPYVLLR